MYKKIWTRELMKNNIILTDLNKKRESIIICFNWSRLDGKTIYEKLCGFNLWSYCIRNELDLQKI